jgi:hypothetical protein
LAVNKSVYLSDITGRYTFSIFEVEKGKGEHDADKQSADSGNQKDLQSTE